jgi:hypothetical protein
MAKKHMKKCSTSLAIKEMEIKSTLRFHLTSVRIAMIKNTTINVGKDVCITESSYTAWRDAVVLIYIPYSWGYAQRNVSQVTLKATAHHVYCIIIHNN